MNFLLKLNISEKKKLKVNITQTLFRERRNNYLRSIKTQQIRESLFKRILQKLDMMHAKLNTAIITEGQNLAQ